MTDDRTPFFPIWEGRQAPKQENMEHINLNCLCYNNSSPLKVKVPMVEGVTKVTTRSAAD